jgi:hypothetical protein
VGRKRDIAQIIAVAQEFRMGPEERREFGDFVEECKRRGEIGSGEQGDFTYAELRDLAKEFQAES